MSSESLPLNLVPVQAIWGGRVFLQLTADTFLYTHSSCSGVPWLFGHTAQHCSKCYLHLFFQDTFPIRLQMSFKIHILFLIRKSMSLWINATQVTDARGKNTSSNFFSKMRSNIQELLKIARSKRNTKYLQLELRVLEFLSCCYYSTIIALPPK